MAKAAYSKEIFLNIKRKIVQKVKQAEKTVNPILTLLRGLLTKIKILMTQLKTPIQNSK
jgi:hypothetical protein